MLRKLRHFKTILALLQVLQKSYPIPLPICHIRNREYYEWLSRLRHHMQIGKLSV